MARQGVSRPKVVSSGRLTGSGRGQIHKKRFAGRCVPPLEAAYSLYSTDSEDQVTTIHKGLDRCAALLNGILQAEQAESKPKQQGTKTCTFKSKPKNLSRKIETDKKKHGKKTNTAIHVKKRAAAVQKTIRSSSCHLSSAGQPSYRGDQNPEVRRAQGSQDQPSALTRVSQAEHAQQVSVPLVYSQPAASCDLQTSGQVHTSTVFNCRLTTSTPALSPQRPGSAHSEPCTSKCVLSSGGSSGEFHQLRAMSVAIPSCPHASEEMSATPNQYAASFSMPPAVQRQSPVTVSPVQNGSCTSVGHGLPIITSPVCSGPQVKLTSSTESLTCPSAIQTPNQLWVSQTQPEPNGPVQEICSEESAEDEDEKDGMDNTPVRDISCQTSYEKLTVLSHKVTPTTSPEKTAQRVVTAKYLLGELKTLVANQDSDAVRLISEVEQSISLLPVMVGSTNIQAEIALAVQPLRSENVQLRRRLRILNQQLSERERAERRARPEACDMEVVTLQSLNFTLQTQLNESRKELDDLQQENMRLQKAKEDKDSDLKQHKELCELENSRLRLEMNEALAEMQSYQSKLKEYEIEKTVLSLSLQQREAEISRLQEVIRNLERSQTKDKYSPQPDLCQPNSQLTKSVLELHENAQRESTVSDQLSNSVKTYLQTLEGIGQASPLQRVHCKSQTLQPVSPGQINGGKDHFMPSDAKVCLPTNRDIHKPTLETIAENIPQSEEQKRTMFAPLKESLVVQLPSGVAHSKPLTQCNELITAKNQREEVDAHVGLKYMGRAFEKLDISDGVHIQDAKNDGRDFLSDHQDVALQLIQKIKGLNNPSVQSLRARRMGVQAAHFGRPSVIENTFSSCDIKSLASDWSINSWSTFNTQDEQNFRDGLAALDASIESLQNTLRVDRNK
ncbi:coiled-coil domain-containing protein 14 [Rhinichthys klamathensis goyatoka]|uniref:coiled-coil domain-containing protein 14 n=1 Tax=Rhinichthys klamathensis goyatoka TaxID=3034132 RepID=UPI0024B524CC|nr:coiled-coil domain-containing protein 14 [Rhinichthys klamathensis goyatoka]